MNAKSGNDVAKVVIPAVIVVWLVGSLISGEGVPGWVVAIAAVAFALFIPALVAVLIMRQTGWREIARRYPGNSAGVPAWKTCRTAIMSTVSRDSPDHRQRSMRLHFILRVAADEHALHLSAPPVLDLLFPRISIPWAAIAETRRFEASGSIPAQSNPGSLVNVAYDPGYRGSFVEIELADPEWFLQLPEALVVASEAREEG